MSTPAIRFLNQRGAPFEVVRYAHRRKGAEFAALATGFALERTLKTLVMDLREGGFGLVLAPGDRQVDFKLVARIDSNPSLCACRALCSLARSGLAKEV